MNWEFICSNAGTAPLFCCEERAKPKSFAAVDPMCQIFLLRGENYKNSKTRWLEQVICQISRY